MAADPVRRLDECPPALTEMYDGPGWYWSDPREFRDDGSRWARITGPYETEEQAREAFHNYCEAMTI